MATVLIEFLCTKTSTEEREKGHNEVANILFDLFSYGFILIEYRTVRVHTISFVFRFLIQSILL